MTIIMMFVGLSDAFHFPTILPPPPPKKKGGGARPCNISTLL